MTTLLAGILVGTYLGVIATLMALREIRRRQMPYRWACPVQGCKFELSAADPVVVAAWANQHQHRGAHA